MRVKPPSEFPASAPVLSGTAAVFLPRSDYVKEVWFVVSKPLLFKVVYYRKSNSEKRYILLYLPTRFKFRVSVYKCSRCNIMHDTTFVVFSGIVSSLGNHTLLAFCWCCKFICTNTEESVAIRQLRYNEASR